MNRHPNLVFVFADQWHRNAVTCMGRDPVVTPRMDAFAGEGMLFEHAYTTNPVCTPSRASIMTGKYPYSNNMMHNWLQLPLEEETMARASKRHGYETGYIGKWHLDVFHPGDVGNHWSNHTPPGPRRMGFDFWYSCGCNHDHFSLNYMRTDGTIHRGEGWQVEHETDRAIEYIENAGHAIRDPAKPFCLYLSWAPPHNLCGGKRLNAGKKDTQYAAPIEFEEPYRSHPPQPPPNAVGHEAKFLDAAPGYFGGINSMDEHFGRLLDCLDREGIAENTIVVLTSDHGEMLQSHGRWLKDIWFEESIGIPFLIRWPGKIPRGVRQPLLFNTPDMMPTLLGLMGCEIPAGCQGGDYSRTLLGEDRPGPEYVFLGYNSGAPEPGMTPFDFPDERGRYWRGVRSRRYTYAIVDDTQRSAYHGDNARTRLPDGVNRVLYDNDEDAWQLHPIFYGQAHDDVMDAHHAALATWLDQLGDDFIGKYYHP